MNNADRDRLLERLDERTDGIVKDIAILKERSHTPDTCSGLTSHMESHGRHNKWLFWGFLVFTGAITTALAIMNYVT